MLAQAACSKDQTRRLVGENFNIFDNMCSLVNHNKKFISYDVLKYIGSIFKFSDLEILERGIINNIIQSLCKNLYNNSKKLVENSLWVLSNITAEGPDFS